MQGHEAPFFSIANFTSLGLWGMAFSKKTAVINADRRRRILIAALGGVCEECGTTEDLEFHHTQPREWVAASLNRWQRQAKYEEDWEAGVIVLLCTDCNKRAGVPVSEADLAEVPF